MAFKKTLVQRLFNLSRFSTPSLCRNTPGKTDTSRTLPKTSQGAARVPARPIHESAGSVTSPVAMRLFPMMGNGIAEKLREMDLTKGRLNLDGLVAFPMGSGTQPTTKKELSVGEVRKVLKATQVEMIRGKLRDVERDWVSYKEYVGLVEDFCGGNRDQALSFAKTLDECGSVIVLGGSVCLRPQQEIRTLVRKI